MADRIFAVVTILAAFFYGLTAWGWDIPFQYEPLGPRAFPTLLAALAIVCSLAVLFRPSRVAERLPLSTLARQAGSCAVMLLYAGLFQWLGFILATTLAGGFFARLFGLAWSRALMFAALMSLVSYYGLIGLLQLNVPAGTLFGG